MEEDNMKKKIVSIIIAFFTMVLSCAVAFADTVTFDKKNKGNEKDFVTMEFNSVEELAALCKKYKKNNAEVLIKAGSPFAKFSISLAEKSELLKIVECFSGAEFDLLAFDKSGVKMSVSLSEITIEGDMLLEFKYDGKQYSLEKISGVKASIVSFFNVKLNENDIRIQNYFNRKVTNALFKQQKSEVNSVGEFEKLYKKHKSDSFYIIIPVGSKIRDEKELDKLSKIIFDDSSIIRKKYMSYFTSDSSVVIESYVKEGAGTGDILDLLLSSASRSVYVYSSESKSTALYLEKQILDAERVTNEQKGLGKITNAEVEKERKVNEAAGRGKLTNSEVLEAQGTGAAACTVYFLDFEIKDESEWNSNFPEGDAKKRIKEAMKKRQQYDFNLLTTLKKLCKGHENESISIIIPVGSNMWNKKELEKILEYLYNNPDTVQKNMEIVSKQISANLPVVIEYYRYQGKRLCTFWRNQSLVVQLEAEVEKERATNEASGYGRITNEELAKKLDEERKSNEKAGLGKLTNAEVEKERATNEASGYGRITNAELKVIVAEKKQTGSSAVCKTSKKL